MLIVIFKAKFMHKLVNKSLFHCLVMVGLIITRNSRRNFNFFTSTDIFELIVLQQEKMSSTLKKDYFDYMSDELFTGTRVSMYNLP